MKRRLNYFMIVVALVFSIAFTASIQAASELANAVKSGKAKSYIVLMANDPVVSYQGEIKGLEATKPGKGGKINPKSAHVKKYQKFLKQTHEASLAQANVDASANVHTYTIALNGYSAILTKEQVTAIKNQKGVVKVIEDVMRYPDTDASGEFLGLTDAGGAYLLGYTGEGVVVGIIDSGIWPEHPSFADDGTYSAPPIVLDDSDRPSCEFGNTAHNELDAPFTCNNKLIGARQMIDTYRALIGAEAEEYDSARDDNGHGTHTASTAAGNSDVHAQMFGIPRGVVTGIAPRAHVVAYKGLGDLGGFTSDLAAAIDQAVSDGVDVINYSIGGGASGPGADEIAFLFADDAGVFVATSAGNSGPGVATVGNPGTMPWVTTVGASTQSRFFQGTATLGDGGMYPGASITQGVGWSDLVDAADIGGDLCEPGSLDPLEAGGKVVLCRRGTYDRVAKSYAVMMAGGVGMILYNNSDADNLYSDNHFVPSVHIDNTPGLAVKAYIAGDQDPAAMITGEELGTWGSAPSMTIFSSRGPNAVSPDIIKPDITAPGHQILAGNSATPIGGVWGELFQSISGTSMSSPQIAGIGALISQARPDWSPAMIRSAMMTTAHQDVVDNDRVSQADPFDFGAGHVDPSGQWNKKGSITQPGLAYPAGLFDYAGYTCGEGFDVFTAGSCAFLESIGVPSDPSDLNLPSIGIAGLAASQIVRRTVVSVAEENGWVTYKVSVDAPPGFSVDVTPSEFKLKKGQSATYEVAITNLGAPVGEWRFGSLTWNGQVGLYSVRSPIAVSAASFEAADSVSGSGTTGSASFEVGFGYTGSYAAAPHGLVANAPTSGDIGQDPDQDYPSDDDASVGVHMIPFAINGAAFVRWSLVIPGDDDLDLFLEDSGGNIIASSTNGGTEELIELTLPADDNYTLVVHGWSVPNAPLPYTLDFWEVPLASGGSLSVDSAPASAVAGTVGTVDISWTGLAAGTEYLGAVSHSGDSGLMGLTLVEVDVP